MAEHNEKGKLGEEIAMIYLKDIGYKILERNWRQHKMEVDIIARDDRTLILAEVKTRASDFFGNPEEFVDVKKQNMLAEAAEDYIERFGLTGIEVRYDIVGVIFESTHVLVLHMPDAFFPDNLNMGNLKH